MYCVKCGKHTDTINVAKFAAKNGRLMQRKTCSVCGDRIHKVRNRPV